jgi:hypothetical protein
MCEYVIHKESQILVLAVCLPFSKTMTQDMPHFLTTRQQQRPTPATAQESAQWHHAPVSSSLFLFPRNNKVGITWGRVTPDWWHSAGKRKPTGVQANIQTTYPGETLTTIPHSTQLLVRKCSVTTNTLIITPHCTQPMVAVTVYPASLDTHNTVHVTTIDYCNLLLS